MAPALLLGVAACAPLGERGLGNGQCPTGEVCSAETPLGLEFVGTAVAGELFADQGPYPTAITGTQDITLRWDEFGTGDFTPLTIPYAAEIESGGALSVVSTDHATVTVRGASDGSAYLRVVDPTTGELFDRYVVSAAPVTGAEVVPADVEELADASAPIAFPAASAQIGIALYGSAADDTSRVVDTSMAVTSQGAVRAAWDTIAIAGATAGSATIAVTAAGVALPALDATLVAGVDAIAFVGGAPTLAYEETSEACLAATSGGAQVVGLSDWTATSTDTDIGSGFTTACFAMTPLAHDSAHITVTAGGATLAATLAVQTAGGVRPRARPTASRRASGGERAVSSMR